MHETGRCTLGDDSELGNSAGYQVGDEVGNSVENLVAKALRSMTSHGSSHLQASKQSTNTTLDTIWLLSHGFCVNSCERFFTKEIIGLPDDFNQS